MHTLAHANTVVFLFTLGLASEAQRKEDLKRRQAHDEALATAMQKLEMESTRDEKYRALIRETAPELRELEAKLRAAYTTKELRNQIDTREAEAEAATLRELETARQMAEAGGGPEEEERQATIRRMEKTRRCVSCLFLFASL
jgi:Skp family chaperone for outer membrane proteins